MNQSFAESALCTLFQTHSFEGERLCRFFFPPGPSVTFRSETPFVWMPTGVKHWAETVEGGSSPCYTALWLQQRSYWALLFL